MKQWLVERIGWDGVVLGAGEFSDPQAAERAGAATRRLAGRDVLVRNPDGSIRCAWTIASRPKGRVLR